MSRPSSLFCGSLSVFLIRASIAQQPAADPAQTATNNPPQPVPQPLSYPAVPNALPPGLYRAGAMPIAPPAFYDLTPYYTSGYAPYGSISSTYGGIGNGYGYGPVFGALEVGDASVRAQRQLARVPYQTAVRDAQDYHYRNQIYKRDETLLLQNISKTSSGTALFRAGQYEQAAIQLLDAADANHGDALSRVRAGHAMFALGRYDQAVVLITRAFELQPGLATLRFDLREEYGSPQDFEMQLVTVERATAARPHDAAAVTMLGYVRYYTSGPGSAFETLQRAKRLDPGNGLIDKLISVAVRVYSPLPAAQQRARASTPASGATPRSAKTAGTPVRKL